MSKKPTRKPTSFTVRLPGGKRLTYIMRPRRLMSRLAVWLLCLAGAMPAHAQLAANALPTGGSVAPGTGSATIATNAATMTVDQTTSKVAIDWTTFNVGSAATVNFVQPNSSAVALNRVSAAGGASEIAGALNANGQVFLVNPNGVLFADTAQVNVGGIVASTLNITDADFLAGTYSFLTTDPNSVATVDNMGTINTASNGYVAFLAPGISNLGTITTPQGTVALVAGDAVTLSFAGNRLIGFTIDQGTLAAYVQNGNAIIADDGLILLSAQAADALSSAQVNNSGILQAATVVSGNGYVRLEAIGAAGGAPATVTLAAGVPGTPPSPSTITADHVAIRADDVVVGPVAYDPLFDTLPQVTTTGSTTDAIVVTASNAFTNNGDNTVFATAPGTRWLVYSANPAQDSHGGTGLTALAADFKHYNCADAAVCAPTQTGNGFIYTVAPVLSVTPGAQAVVYGTGANFTPTYTGFIDGDASATAGIGGTANYSIGGIHSTSANPVVGVHEVSYASGLTSSLGYQFADNAASVNELAVSVKAITATGITAASKVYNANTVATLNAAGAAFAAGSVVAGDNVVLGTAAASGAFADKHAGTAKAVTVSGLALSGTDAANYSVADASGATANITAKAITATGITAASKVYNANTVATLNTTAATLASGATSDADSKV
ncbi:MAG: filamentous hemagglutinin N-terminal domain-containing protein, partial [Rhodocyclales bacterium]|nr:filamentous hemagglutinin N-terminal domain-containing protein [Rhodocyclales bacterium]